MSAQGKSEILALVYNSGLPRRRALIQLGLPKSTYYRWLRQQTEGRLQDNKGGASLPWNKLRPEEEEKILAQARASPELSARQLALKLVDSEGWYVSESTVFRILKREGLIKPAEIVGFKAGKEYHRKAKRPNELWATDCAHLKVIDWGTVVSLPHLISIPTPYLAYKRQQQNGLMRYFQRRRKVKMSADGDEGERRPCRSRTCDTLIKRYRRIVPSSEE